MGRRGCVAAAAVLLLLPGCAALARGGQDLAVVATVPVHVLTTPVGCMAEDAGREPGLTALTAPVRYPFYVLRDVFLTAISAVDALLTPVYAPFRVPTLDLYRFDRFPPRYDEKNGAETAATVLVAPAVLVGVLLRGAAEEGSDAHGRAGGPPPPPDWKRGP